MMTVMERMRCLPVVGVMGSGSECHRSLAGPLGGMIARLGVHLLTGGGQGVMRCVAEGFTTVEDRAGLSLGVLPGFVTGDGCSPPDGYPNCHVELVIQTHLPGRGADGEGAGSRNAINVLSAKALVILPGQPLAVFAEFVL